MTKLHSASLLAALVALPTLSFAGSTAKAPAPAAPEKINNSAITGDLGVSVYSAMYSRGSILANYAPTVLPYFDLYATAYEGDGFLNKVVLSLNVTEYFSRPNPSPTGINFAKTANHKSWYENDFIPGAAFTFGKVTISESFHWYEEPNENAGTFMGVNSSISYDDGDLLGAFALHPSFTYMQKINGHGSYYEVAGGPSAPVGPVTVALPLAVGFNSDNFGGTGKDGFGYFSAGLKFSYTLPVSKTYGTWSTSTGVTYYAKDKKVVGGSSDSDVVVYGGVQVAF